MHRPTTDALRAHLTTPMGSPLSMTRIPPLMVPGGNPNARNTEVVFLADAITTWPHPYNNNQTPVIAGRIPAFSDRLFYVALAHLAHFRHQCDHCDPIWTANDQRWTDIPDNNAHGHKSLFASLDWHPSDVDLKEPSSLLLHIDDVPRHWF